MNIFIYYNHYVYFTIGTLHVVLEKQSILHKIFYISLFYLFINIHIILFYYMHHYASLYLDMIQNWHVQLLCVLHVK
jgi:hypothetical protein